MKRFPPDRLVDASEISPPLRPLKPGANCRTGLSTVLQQYADFAGAADGHAAGDCGDSLTPGASRRAEALPANSRQLLHQFGPGGLRLLRLPPPASRHLPFIRCSTTQASLFTIQSFMGKPWPPQGVACITPQHALTSASSNSIVPNRGEFSSEADRTTPANRRVSTKDVAGDGDRSDGCLIRPICRPIRSLASRSDCTINC